MIKERNLDVEAKERQVADPWCIHSILYYGLSIYEQSTRARAHSRRWVVERRCSRGENDHVCK